MLIKSLNSKDKKLSVILTLVIFFIYLYLLNIFENFNLILTTPVTYSGDSLFSLSNILNLTNDFPFFNSERLNYPYGSNLTDGYLASDKLIQFLAFLFTKYIGLYETTYFLDLTSHILSGLSMFYICKLIGINSLYSFTGSLIFSFSNFITIRSFGHLTVTFVFIVPIIILSISNLLNDTENWKKKNSKIVHYLAFAISPALNIYYFYILLILASITATFQFFRNNNEKFLFILKLIFLSLIFFLILNFNFIHDAFENPMTVKRNIAGFELYGLKLPELLIPSYHNKIPILGEIGQYLYYGRSMLLGEHWGPYLGANGVIFFIFFLFYSFFNFAKHKKFKLAELQFQMCFVIIFSLVGGIGLMLAIFDLNPARGGNRYSIFILCISIIAFFYIINNLEKYFNNKFKIYITLCCFVLLYLDLPNPMSNSHLVNIKESVENDKQLISSLENKIKNPNLAIMPHMKYPENGPINKMLDYEPMRLFINSKSANFSYGHNRYSNNKKIHIFNEDILKTLQILKKYNYNYLLINQLGYTEEKLSKIIDILKKNKISQIIVDHKNYLVFDLSSLNKNILTKDIYFYNYGWSEKEPSWRWALSKNAGITILTNKDYINLEFELQSHKIERNYKIFFNKNLLKEGKIDRNKKTIKLRLYTKNIDINSLEIKVDGGRFTASFRDRRKITFALHNLRIN